MASIQEPMPRTSGGTMKRSGWRRPLHIRSSARWPRGLAQAAAVSLLLLGLLPSTAVAQAATQTVVTLTFHDALITQYTNARPILQAHNMNGTFYLPSGWVNRGSSSYYAWWQADNLYKDGNEIGGMGFDHKDLTQVYYTDWTQDYAYKKQQVCDDFNLLARRGYDPRSFAYPAAAYNYTFPDGSNVRGIVKACGYMSGRTVGGFSPSGPTYAETLPPKDAYAIRTLSNPSTGPVQLSTMLGTANVQPGLPAGRRQLLDLYGFTQAGRFRRVLPVPRLARECRADRWRTLWHGCADSAAGDGRSGAAAPAASNSHGVTDL
jgi:peptidoglycan/xylan/chitin deacetylase (PgdA/CDA1 family)